MSLPPQTTAEAKLEQGHNYSERSEKHCRTTALMAPRTPRPRETLKLASVQRCRFYAGESQCFTKEAIKKPFLSPLKRILLSRFVLLSCCCCCYCHLPPSPPSVLTSPFRFLSLITFNSSHSFLSGRRGAVSTGGTL